MRLLLVYLAHAGCAREINTLINDIAEELATDTTTHTLKHM